MTECKARRLCEGKRKHDTVTCYKIGPGLEVKKRISCSTQLSMNFFLLINVKMPTIVCIVTFMSKKNSILGLYDPKNAEFLDIFILMSF